MLRKKRQSPDELFVLLRYDVDWSTHYMVGSLQGSEEFDDFNTVFIGIIPIMSRSKSIYR